MKFGVILMVLNVLFLAGLLGYMIGRDQGFAAARCIYDDNWKSGQCPAPISPERERAQ